MLGVDGSTNVFVKKGDIDVQVDILLEVARVYIILIFSLLLSKKCFLISIQR